MAVSKIEVNEYKCIRCGYRWINRVNGKDGPHPKKCARCKRSNWNRDIVSPKEHGLRRRIKGFKALYKEAARLCLDRSIADCWSGELAKEFLNLDPRRPTITELERVVYPPGGLVIKDLTSQNQFNRYSSYVGYVPDPENLDSLKYDKAEYVKIVKKEAQKRQEIMKEIIKTRQG